MKLIKITTLSVFICIAIVLVLNKISEKSFENCNIIWVVEGVSENSLLFEVNQGRRVRITEGNVIFDTEKKEVFYGEQIKTKVKKIWSKDYKRISKLLEEISKNDATSPQPGNGTTEVFAFIDGKIYWSPMMEGNKCNKKLLELTKVLLEYAN